MGSCRPSGGAARRPGAYTSGAQGGWACLGRDLGDAGVDALGCGCKQRLWGCWLCGGLATAACRVTINSCHTVLTAPLCCRLHPPPALLQAASCEYAALLAELQQLADTAGLTSRLAKTAAAATMATAAAGSLVGEGASVKDIE